MNKKIPNGCFWKNTLAAHSSIHVELQPIGKILKVEGASDEF